MFLGFLTAAIGGRPAMISGAAGAMAVVAKDIMASDGKLDDLSEGDRFDVLMWTMFLCGVVQMLFGVFRVAKFVKLIPETAMLGFMNGLAIVIFMAQLTAFQACRIPEAKVFNDCEVKEREWLKLDETETWLTLVLVFLTMAVMVLWPKVPKIGGWLPASFVALALATFVEHVIYRIGFDRETRTVKDTAPLNESFSTPTFPPADMLWKDGTALGMSLQYAVQLAAIGAIESVMTLQAVDEITGAQPSTFRANQECVAQGVANFVSSFFGAMGGDAMIGQSTINVMNGARGRLSGMSAGIFMLCIILGASAVVEAIPIAALTGVLFMVVIHTFNWGTFKTLRRASKADAFVVVLVTVLAVVTNLAIAVISGVVFTALVDAWRSSQMLTASTEILHDENGRPVKVYHFSGALFFGSTRTFANMFDYANDPEHVLLDFRESVLADWSALAAVKAVAKRYAEVDKNVEVQRLDAFSVGRVQRAGSFVAETVALLHGDKELYVHHDKELNDDSDGPGVVVHADVQHGDSNLRRRKSLSQLHMFEPLQVEEHPSPVQPVVAVEPTQDDNETSQIEPSQINETESDSDNDAAATPEDQV
ncbi:MAG: hypothetical protein MHM6MM_002297 [Cercozoa sp. M6MM]